MTKVEQFHALAKETSRELSDGTYCHVKVKNYGGQALNEPELVIRSEQGATVIIPIDELWNFLEPLMRE